MSRHRKHAHEEHVNHERWLVTYADLITLLLAFFVILYSMSNLDAEKYKKLAEAMGNEFGGKKMGGSGGVMGNGGEARQVTAKPEAGKVAGQQVKEEKIKEELPPTVTSDQVSEEFKALAKKIEQVSSNNNLKGQIVMREEGRGLILQLVDSMLFSTGSADLPDKSANILTLVGRELSNIPNPIRVEGHTDDVPISTPFYPNNWYLSTSRAMKVVMLWDNMKLISADRLSGAGYGSHRPIDTNKTPEGRARNRRVDIIVIRKSVAQQEPEVKKGGVVSSVTEASVKGIQDEHVAKEPATTATEGHGAKKEAGGHGTTAKKTPTKKSDSHGGGH